MLQHMDCFSLSSSTTGLFHVLSLRLPKPPSISCLTAPLPSTLNCNWAAAAVKANAPKMLSASKTGKASI